MRGKKHRNIREGKNKGVEEENKHRKEHERKNEITQEYKRRKSIGI